MARQTGSDTGFRVRSNAEGYRLEVLRGGNWTISKIGTREEIEDHLKYVLGPVATKGAMEEHDWRKVMPDVKEKVVIRLVGDDEAKEGAMENNKSGQDKTETKPPQKKEKISDRLADSISSTGTRLEESIRSLKKQRQEIDTRLADMEHTLKTVRKFSSKLRK